MPNGPGATGTPRGSTPFAPGISETGARRAGRHGTDEVPVVTGVPVSRPTVWPEASFDVFTPIRRPEQEAVQPDSPADAPYPQAYPDFGAQASDASYAEFGSDGAESNGLADGGYDGGGTGEEGYKGLPRRVRQASLAPELRATAAANSNGNAGAVPRASAESLTVMRNTLSAMQRGWQQGRSESQGDTEGNVNGD